MSQKRGQEKVRSQPGVVCSGVPIDWVEQLPLSVQLRDSSAKKLLPKKQFSSQRIFCSGFGINLGLGKHFWEAKQSENGLFWASLKASRPGLSGRVKLPKVMLPQPTNLMRVDYKPKN